MFGSSGQGTTIELGERPILALSAMHEWKSIRFPSGATNRLFRRVSITNDELGIDDWKTHLAAVASFGGNRLTGDNLLNVLKQLGPNSVAKKNDKFNSVVDIGYSNATFVAYLNLCGISFSHVEKLSSVREPLFNMLYRGIPDFCLRLGQVSLKSTLSRARGLYAPSFVFEYSLFQFRSCSPSTYQSRLRKCHFPSVQNRNLIYCL